ncbi:MAG: DUF47 family protein [Candidatus Methanomethyliaceae archaeon]|nr:DUF47 family protein [Candidatus Methanomethyliaceae archaeon]
MERATLTIPQEDLNTLGNEVYRKSLDLITEHARKVQDSVRLMVESFSKFKASQRSELKSIYEKISAVEEDADKIKRELIEQLTKSAPAFLYREDFIRLIICVDEVAELAQSVSRQLSRISDSGWVPSPVVGELFERVSSEVLTEYERLRDAIMVLPSNPKRTIGLVVSVHEAESKVDSSYYDADFKLLMEVKKIEQLLIYRDLLRLLEDMADLIEDASDDLRVLALHRVA